MDDTEATRTDTRNTGNVEPYEEVFKVNAGDLPCLFVCACVYVCVFSVFACESASFSGGQVQVSQNLVMVCAAGAILA